MSFRGRTPDSIQDSLSNGWTSDLNKSQNHPGLSKNHKSPQILERIIVIEILKLHNSVGCVEFFDSIVKRLNLTGSH